jgi:hypothetical protein
MAGTSDFQTRPAGSVHAASRRKFAAGKNPLARACALGRGIIRDGSEGLSFDGLKQYGERRPGRAKRLRSPWRGGFLSAEADSGRLGQVFPQFSPSPLSPSIMRRSRAGNACARRHQPDSRPLWGGLRRSAYDETRRRSARIDRAETARRPYRAVGIRRRSRLPL